MTDHPDDAAGEATGGPADETPIQRALRLKKAALKAKPKLPGRDNDQRRSAASVPTGASKPWLKK